MATVVINENLIGDKFLQACRIIQKMRHYKRKWKKDHEAATRIQLEFWENKADQFMDSLTIEEDNAETITKLKEPS